MIAELRRSYAHLNSYKSDIVVISGLDAGDRIALDYKFKKSGAPPCQYDKEDRRFVMRGPHFAPMEILNCLAQERGYKIIYPPQQHGIPLKPGAMDDKFALLYQLSKEVIRKPKKEPSLPDATIPAKKQPFGEKIYEDLIKKQKTQVTLPDVRSTPTLRIKQPFDDAMYTGKGWDKLMHGNQHGNRRAEVDDSDTDELDSDEEKDEKNLDMNVTYDDDVEVDVGGDCGDGGDM